MTVRRHTDPVIVKKIWDAIRSAAHAHLTADSARIIKYLQDIDGCSQVEAEWHLKRSLKDKLIIPSKKLEGGTLIYKVTEQELPQLDGKDWYCFECHLAGDVTLCTSCFRVFHQKCVASSKNKFEVEQKTNNYARQNIPKEDKSIPVADQLITIIDDDTSNSSKKDSIEADSADSYDEALCSVCNLSRIDYSCGLDHVEINYMLKFVLNRIRNWLPHTITLTMAAEDRPEWLTDSELTWRANHLFFEHRDMSVIEVKLNTGTYVTFADFVADVYTVQHNVAIFHGADSQEYGAAELMVRDTLHDITEMKTCVDCYRHSNEKINNRWFCLPCRIPHKLVWAKQKGYPYWPAKVIKETGTHFDVRFFGAKYERALLVKSLIKPITFSKEALQIKPTAAFNKAYEELKYHQTLLNDPVELEKLKAMSKPRRKTLLKTSTPQIHAPSSSSTSDMIKSKKNKPNSSVQPAQELLPEVEVTPPKVMLEKRRNSSSFDDTKVKKKKLMDEEQNSSQISGNVIDISDGEEDSYEYSFRENTTQNPLGFDETYEQVSSSTENFGKQFSNRKECGMQPLDQPYSDSVEKMRRKLENLSNKKDIIKCAMDCMQLEIDRITNDNNEHLKQLFESHNQQLSETKKKQWCYNCEQDAIYHCCWNTAYCSQTCQQQHWQAEHKKVCRRKR